METSRLRVCGKRPGGVPRTHLHELRACTYLCEEHERSIPLTHPGNDSPVEAGQLGVVVGNLLFDDPGGDRQTLSYQEKDGRAQASPRAAPNFHQKGPVCRFKKKRKEWKFHTYAITLNSFYNPVVELLNIYLKKERICRAHTALENVLFSFKQLLFRF